MAPNETREAEPDAETNDPLPAAAVAQLAANHRNFLRFLEQRVGNRAEAEDILQEAFVRGVERVSALREGESAVAWFYRVLRNAVVDHARRRQAAGRALDAFARELEQAVEPAIEMRQAVCACVRTLSETLKPEYAEALQRVEIDGASVSGYASELGIQANNAAVRVHRAREALRRRVLASCGTCCAHGCLNCTCESAPSASPPRGCASGAASTSATPASTRYRNPVIAGFHPDPSICRVGDDYYLVTSSFEYFPGVPIFHSRDLRNWRQIGHVLTRASQLPLVDRKSSEGIYAPTLRHHQGTYYLITTNVGGKGNFYVTARDPKGPWSEPVWLQESSFGIDPSLLFDDDGRVYFTREGEGERGGIYQRELDLERGQLLGEMKLIWSGTGGVWPEGPHLYKIAGQYYLMIAEGGTGYDHMQTIARSASPWGPFEACPHNPILTHRGRTGHPIQATGHADLVQASDGAWWLVFLGIRPTDGKHHHLGRETFLAPVSWDDAGWPVVNGNVPVELAADAQGLPPEVPWPALPARDDFDAPALGMVWNFVRNPDPASFSLSARPGWLRLVGTASSLDEVGLPAFVGRRQQHFRCRASTWLEFQPTRAAEVAGLVLRANEANHYDLLVVGDGAGRRHVELRARVQGESKTVAQQPLPPGPVLLAVDARADRYEFSCTSGGGAAISLGAQPTAPLSSEAAGGFTGVYFGLYAYPGAGGGGPAAPADFDWFEYRALDDRASSNQDG